MIKKLWSIIFFMAFTRISFSQQIDTIPKNVSSSLKGNVEYYLDSNKVDIDKYFFDVDQILNITVVQANDSAKRPVGRIFIKSKFPNAHNFISLNQVKDFYCKSVTQPYIFMVDNLFLKDNLSMYKIDSTYILRVEIMKGTEFESLQKDIPNLTIIIIKTKTAENLNEDKKIHLRGNKNNL